VRAAERAVSRVAPASKRGREAAIAWNLLGLLDFAIGKKAD